MNFSSPSIDELYTSLHSSYNGLSRRRVNALKKARKGSLRFRFRIGKELRLLIRQFTNPLVLILIIVVILSVLLNQKADVFIISIIILLTGVLGFVQEVNAGRASEKLLAMIKVKHAVVREGRELQVDTEDVLPGDVLLLNAGDIIPADCRIIESNELHVNESSLTGESFPAEKGAGNVPESTPLNLKQNCLWQGTSVISGTARALVAVTGEQTIFGQMSKGLKRETQTAFEQGIIRFGFFLLRITVLLSIFILLSNLYFGKPFFISLLFSLALAIGMAPELLPAIMTVAMAAGAKRMMKEKVIVKKLSSIFNFGEVNVLCTDKTGTITEGNIRVHDVVNVSGLSDSFVKFQAYLNSYFEKGFNNPIDEAVRSLKLDATGYSRTDEIPYDFIRKRLSVAVKSEKGNLLITKGAVEQVLEVCSSLRAAEGVVKPLDGALLTELNEKFAAYAREGIRVLGLAYKELDIETIKRADEARMVFCGFILLEDPLKTDVRASIERLEELRIEVKIITGDNRFAALHTASELGLENPKVIAGADIDAMSPEALQAAAPSICVFAEIEPHQKERIVRALQKAGSAVAYLGDGINDVAAIHAADTGISTNNAVDVAKEAADFVLMEKDLAVLANGVFEGRKSFTNSMKYIFASTGSTFGNMFSVAAASLILPFLPLLPQQILFSNLITDIPFLAIASDRVEKSQITRPLKWDIGFIRRFMLLFGLHSSVFDFITFYILFFHFKLMEERFQSAWLIESILTELFILFIVRSRGSILKSSPAPVLLWVTAGAVALSLLLPFSPFAELLKLVPLDGQVWGFLLLVILFYCLTAELLKRWFFSHLAGRSVL